jgi:hypothetical protein
MSKNATFTTFYKGHFTRPDGKVIGSYYLYFLGKNNPSYSCPHEMAGQIKITLINSCQAISSRRIQSARSLIMSGTVTSRGKAGRIRMPRSQSLRALTVVTSFLIVALSFFRAGDANAATYYVNAGNSAPMPPYTSWLTAATNIQDAIAETVNGDTVLVTNGVYGYGGAVMVGTLTNRVALTNAITVESVNGPWVTSILGTSPGGPKGRCAWLTNGASLIGFTLTGGVAESSEINGGGVWCASSNAYVQSCVIVSNIASDFGAGVYQGTLTSCLIHGNSAAEGAVYKAVLNNCTIVSNSEGGVLSPLAMTNCIIYFNINNQNYGLVSGSAFVHCCTTPALAGTGNFTNAPALFADGVHLLNNSPCIGSGVYIGGGTDIFGNPYLDPPSVGCTEQTSAPLAGTPQITLTSSPVGFSVGNFAFTGIALLSFSWLENGQPLTDNGHFSGTQTSNLLASGVSLADAGNYQVVVGNSFGSVTSAVTTLVIHCVNVSGANPVPPYTSWATATTNIQNAITASAAGDVVLVTNGLYNSGGISMDGYITNRVSINKAILVDSVNGPAATIIQGAWDPTATNGPGAVRCVWMTNNTILGGFTICGGATREEFAQGAFSTQGGGVLAASTNSVIYDCVLTTNIASFDGGGIFGFSGASETRVISCSFIGNQAGPIYAAYGGGAYACNLQNCILLDNASPQGDGGGAAFCNLKNSALSGNWCANFGWAAYSDSLANCTVISNTTSSAVLSGATGPAVYSATLTNCIVIDNFSRFSIQTNYASSTLAYCCADPLPPGTGNIDVNPQVLADGFHLAQTSPCIGTGLSNVVSGTDIDGQPWNTPPSIGCDEWYPEPIVIVQPSFQIGSPPHDLTWNVAIAGQSPFSYFWTQNGVAIQDDGHHSNSGTANLVINNFGPNDAGLYQLVATNSSGSATSAVIQVVIHAVNASGANPVPPYSSWANAATTIQDAVNVSASGDIVLVTNGVYAKGGMVEAGGLTNRVMLNVPVTVISVNGFKSTVIQGAWDPLSTNGPGAVRCVWLGPGAVLNGFTLENGATFATGDGFQFGPLESGGGVWGDYVTNAVVLDCELTNNSAVYGGGAAWGTVDNSLIVGNQATYGGGVGYSSLNNCTVENNQADGAGGGRGAGTYDAIARNCIVVKNYDFPNVIPDNYYPFEDPGPNYAYCCSIGNSINPPPGSGNIVQDPTFVDLYHISTLSPCYGTGSAAYSTGCDLDGQPWNNPPSMGCSEIVLSNLVGPLSVNCSAFFTNILINHYDSLYGAVQGRAAYLTWSFGDGPIYSNMDDTTTHAWTNTGNYSVTFTAYNNDNPNGVSTNLLVQVQPALPVQIQSLALLTNGFGFQFTGQMSANYSIQYTTNLNPPITWQTIQGFTSTNQGTIQILDPSKANAARFYRVLTQ